MAKKDPLKQIIKEIENMKELKKLPLGVRKMLIRRLKSMMTEFPIPIVTFREENWILATTPAINVCAQGKTEKKAIENLQAMIEDYMTDPDTKKPKIKTIVNMQIGIKSIPVKLPIDNLGSGQNRQNPPITSQQG